MGWIRSLTWLVALLAFAASSFAPASIAHATQSPERSTAADCPEHAPPPDPCPAEGTARHATGDCCPLMAGVVALLPPFPLGQAQALFHARPATVALNLIGLVFTQDPPPPRV